MRQQVAVHQKLSSQLTLAADDYHQQDASKQAGKTALQPSTNQASSSSSSAADMPARASLIVHEIFGTDPLSEHVLPALRQVQQQLAAPGARFVPRAIRVIAAVAACPALQQRLRLPLQQSGSTIPFDVSSLLPLQPRKIELQLDDLAQELQLLMAPASVLEIDFEKDWPLRLNGQVDVQLPALEAAVSLSSWMQQQQQLQPQVQHVTAQQQQQQQQQQQLGLASSLSGGGGGLTQQLHRKKTQKKKAGAAAATKELCVVSWFEADCGAGGWLSTAPGTTKYGHWQQSVEFVAVPPAAAAIAAAVLGGGLASFDEDGNGSSSSSGSLSLRVNWAVDRLKFSLAA
jgi:hypothetical protein